MSKALFDRRTALKAGLGAAVAPLVLAGGAYAEGEVETYGLSTFGDLGLPRDFKQFAYVDPNAPKGGQIILQVSSTFGNQNFNTFNTLNPYILKGDGAAGIDMIYDTLLTGSLDESDAIYGLVAHTIRISADKLIYRFLLRKEARFHDGSKLTAKDVVYSLDILRTKGHPSLRQALQDVDAVEAEADDVVMVRFKPGRSREAPLIVAGQPIFSAAYYATHEFDATSLERPLGSAAYKIGNFEQGRYIVFRRVPDYWAKDLPINVGQSNFDSIRYEYFADRNVAFEAFKGGVFTFREEYTSTIWATGYEFAAFREGRVKRETVPDSSPSPAQAWFFNTRRPQFVDPRIRDAISFAFDFKWVNTNIMFGTYRRTVSYFPNTPMAATGKPSPEELALLEPFRKDLPPAVFEDVYMPAEGDGSGQDRALLQRANQMLMEAGCKRVGGVMQLPSGEPLVFEFLVFESIFESRTAQFIKNLKLLGIDAQLHIVDSTQYARRVNEFDFDVIVSSMFFGESPGEGLRNSLGSAAATMNGSRNFVGIKDPVLDALIAKALVADKRENLTIICRCIDRILRAGHYWVPMWNKPAHLLAFWDIFSRPAQPPKFGTGAVSTWWYDEAKAKRINYVQR